MDGWIKPKIALWTFQLTWFHIPSPYCHDIFFQLFVLETNKDRRKTQYNLNYEVHSKMMCLLSTMYDWPLTISFVCFNGKASIPVILWFITQPWGLWPACANLSRPQERNHFDKQKKKIALFHFTDAKWHMNLSVDILVLCWKPCRSGIRAKG